MSKPVILTGLRANNDLHIGNYLGALLPIVDLAKTKGEDYQINLFVPDLHSFTTPIDHSQLQTQIMQNLGVFVAAGLPLDNPNVHIYRQSYIPAHSELTWILDCFTGFGEMSRMTQFKDKSGTKYILDRVMDLQESLERELKKYEKEGDNSQEQQINFLKGELFKTLDTISRITKDELSKSSVRVGLFNYPVLMAADILLYNATYVPVGDDQSQHLEFTRDIAERMNAKFGDIFTIPKAVKEQHEFFGKDQGLRIKDLVDPAKKMSKSDDTGKGVIFLSDTPDEARKKIMSATTDSLENITYDPYNQPGVSNLLQLLALLSNDSVMDIAEEFKGQTMYGALKTTVADEVVKFLTDFQTRYAAVDEAAIFAKLQESEAVMREQAAETLLKAQTAVGLRG